MSNRTNRRKFLATLSAFASTTLLRPSIGCAKDEVDADYYGGLPMGIQSYSLRKFGVREAIRHTQGLGLRYMELYSEHLAVDATVDTFNDMMAAAGVAMNGHGVTQFTADHEANRRIFRFAQHVGIRNITANPQPDSFDSLDELVDEYNIRIAIHNHGPDSLFDKLEDVQTAIKDRHANIGACIDTGHVLRSGEDPLRWVRALKGRTYGMHIKDVDDRKKITRCVILGTGHLDVDGLFAAIHETKFPADGAMSIEYESNPDNPVDDIRQCLEIARESIAKLK